MKTSILISILATFAICQSVSAQAYVIYPQGPIVTQPYMIVQSPTISFGACLSYSYYPAPTVVYRQPQYYRTTYYHYQARPYYQVRPYHGSSLKHRYSTYVSPYRYRNYRYQNKKK